MAVQDLMQQQVSYELDTALLVYRARKTSYDYSGGEGLPGRFITTHRILDGGRIGAGRPLTKKAYREIFMEVARPRPVYIPENVVVSSYDGTVIWWRLAGRVFLFFTEATGIRSGSAPMPPMLFRLAGKSLSAWALMKNARPLPETLLYRAPLFNISMDGRVCMGNIKTPKTGMDSLKEWEEAFFGGESTNEGPPPLKGVMAKDLWNGLISGEAETFPVDVLVSAGCTLAHLIEKGGV